MGLKLPNIPNLFPHSRATRTGLGSERIGQSSIIVALDGTGDVDTIQDGIDRLPSDGGSIYIKEGTFEITTSVILESNILIQGTGAGTIILSNMGAATPFFINSDTVSGNSGIIISDITIDCGDNAHDPDVFDLSKVSNSTFTNIYFKAKATKNLGDLILLKSTSNGNIISGCYTNEYTSANNTATIKLEGTNNVIDGNSFQKVVNGILISGNNNIISNNIIDGDAVGGCGNGIQTSGDYTTIIGNRVLDITDTNGIVISAGSDRSVVIGNISYGNTGGNLIDGGTNTQLGHNITA